MAAMWRIAAFAVALFSAGALRAAEETTYLYGAVGVVRTDPGIDQAAADAGLLAAGATEFSSKLDRWDSGWKIMVGWMPNRRFALEGGFTALGTAAYNAAFTNGQAKSEFKSGANLFDPLGLAPLSDSFSLFAKLGGIAASVVTNQSVTLPGGNTANTSASARMLAPNFGVGAIYDFARNGSVRFEVERFQHLGSDATGVSNVDMISLGFVLRL
jgi:hypothetical protein